MNFLGCSLNLENSNYSLMSFPMETNINTLNNSNHSNLQNFLNNNPNNIINSTVLNLYLNQIAGHPKVYNDNNAQNPNKNIMFTNTLNKNNISLPGNLMSYQPSSDYVLTDLLQNLKNINNTTNIENNILLNKKDKNCITNDKNTNFLDIFRSYSFENIKNSCSNGNNESLKNSLSPNLSFKKLLDQLKQTSRIDNSTKVNESKMQNIPSPLKGKYIIMINIKSTKAILFQIFFIS